MAAQMRGDLDTGDGEQAISDDDDDEDDNEPVAGQE